ncbi:MAG: ABC transporter substrate-binding protein [Alphaproteobacteria bacterium]|nr:ABC transporter substrate-binding protein [Alphaproteobacteria bacterium]
MIKRLIPLILISALFPLSAYAQDQYGLAMHGDPKYTADATHLDYVNTDAPKGGSLKIAAIGTFDTVNPFSIKGKSAQGLHLFYDRLMARVWDEPFTLYPLIAKNAEMPEDRSSITFTIDERARFHDGTPITVDDVIFSFETLKESGRPNMRRIYQLIDNVEKLDQNSVKFSFGEGYDRETGMIMAIMPVLSQKYWKDRTFDSTTLDIPVSSGPYKIKSFDPGHRIIYERDPDYWAKDSLTNTGHNNFDEIVYEYFRDNSVAFEGFASGVITFRREGDLRKWHTGYTFPAIESGDVMKEALPHGRPEKTKGFIFNTRREPFDDIRVREAINLLFNRNAVNEILFNNEQKFITSYFPNSEFEALAFRERPEKMPFDLRGNMRLASQLLKDAGWSVENGVQTKNGQPMSFELILQNPDEEKIALHFQQNLKRLGIDMRIRLTDSAGFVRRLNTYDYDMVLHHWQSTLSPGTEQVVYWSCEAAEQEGRFNYPGICDEEIDKLAGSVANTVTREELVDTMRKLDAKLLEGHYMVPLFYAGVDHVAYWKPIQRPETTPLYGLVLETWWMDGDTSTNQD